MRLKPTNLQHVQRLHSHAQGQSIHLGPLTWQEAVLLTATVTIALCLLGEYDRRGENQVKQTIVDHSTTVRSILFSTRWGNVIVNKARWFHHALGLGIRSEAPFSRRETRVNPPRCI
jgi:hypothetical protein